MNASVDTSSPTADIEAWYAHVAHVLNAHDNNHPDFEMWRQTVYEQARVGRALMYRMLNETAGLRRSNIVLSTYVESMQRTLHQLSTSDVSMDHKPIAQSIAQVVVQQPISQVATQQPVAQAIDSSAALVPLDIPAVHIVVPVTSEAKSIKPKKVFGSKTKQDLVPVPVPVAPISNTTHRYQSDSTAAVSIEEAISPVLKAVLHSVNTAPAETHVFADDNMFGDNSSVGGLSAFHLQTPGQTPIGSPVHHPYAASDSSSSSSSSCVFNDEDTFQSIPTEDEDEGRSTHTHVGGKAGMGGKMGGKHTMGGGKGGKVMPMVSGGGSGPVVPVSATPKSRKRGASDTFKMLLEEMPAKKHGQKQFLSDLDTNELRNLMRAANIDYLKVLHAYVYDAEIQEFRDRTDADPTKPTDEDVRECAYHDLRKLGNTNGGPVDPSTIIWKLLSKMSNNEDRYKMLDDLSMGRIDKVMRLEKVSCAGRTGRTKTIKIECILEHFGAKLR